MLVDCEKNEASQFGPERRAVVTLCIGEEFRQIGRISHPLMRAYAARCQADFSVIEECKFPDLKRHYEKFQIADILEHYDRLLFLDSDILVNPSSPNVFDLVRAEQFGATIVSEAHRRFDSEIETIQRELGGIGWNRTHFNSGVMVVSRIHKSVFDPGLEVLEHWCHGEFRRHNWVLNDQPLINYMVQKLGIGIHDLGYRYNHTRAFEVSNRQSYFVHYAGRGPKGVREEQMRVDRDAMNAGHFSEHA